MDQLTITVSPKLSAALKASGKVVGLINELLSRFLEACIDGKLSFDEIVALIVLMCGIAKALIKK